MTTLYFDTASTGLRKLNTPVGHAKFPHILRLAWWLEGDEPKCHLVQPRSGWTMHPSDEARHGISFDIAGMRGQALGVVLKRFTDDLAHAEFAACYNNDFHSKMIENACLEAQHHLEWPRRPFCLMREATTLVRKPQQGRHDGFAYPKMQEAYEYFTHQPMRRHQDEPDLIARGRYVVACLREIHQGIITERKQQREG